MSRKFESRFLYENAFTKKSWVVLLGAVVKKTAYTLALILVLLFTVLTGTWFANLAKGNPNTFFHWHGVYIVSPWNATYSTNIVQLEIQGPPLTSASGFIPEKCWYRVDDEEKTYLDWDAEMVKDELNLTEGTHSISVGLVYSSFE